jgi:hypothetical protein
MKGASGLILAILMLFQGCQKPGRVIAAGTPLSEASNLLRYSGYEDISGSVGIRGSSYASWWISPDNTCIVVLYGGKLGSDRVGGFILGEKGKGYGGKMQWIPQTKVRVNELPIE